ncbi:hypothetical protein [Pseudomonas sp. MWU12-3103b]|uniref:hypothetical protein n=1 Tax=Pseudomonas sp. MWU12-3103b TaxID=2928857 RepID=UPI001FFE6616|nr:hypothetical protein [Pseudomonas sp. MWU12-3103b]
MSNAILLKQLGVDENLKPLPIEVQQQPVGKYYKAEFNPDFPPIPSFRPELFIYASLVPGSVSIIGRYHEADVFYQITIIIDQKLESGTYPIKKGDESPVRASVIASGGIISSDNGEIKLKRDDKNKSIYADFDFQIEPDGKPHKVQGRLELLASGPLDKPAQ